MRDAKKTFLLRVGVNLKPKLIIVEGIPGAGKSTTASYIKSYLDKIQTPSTLYKEGDLDHPADYESVACLTNIEYSNLLSTYENDKDLLIKNTTKRGNDYFCSYGKMRNDSSLRPSHELLKELSTYEVYELPLEKYAEVCRGKWLEFAEGAQDKDSTAIFECCFLQNPLTTMLARHNADESYIKNHIQDLVEIINDLNPLIILLDQGDVRKTFERVCQERLIEWLDYVIGYVTRQAYGLANNLNGFEGLIEFYKVLRSTELAIFDTISFRKLLVINPDSNWHESHRTIDNFLSSVC